MRITTDRGGRGSDAFDWLMGQAARLPGAAGAARLLSRHDNLRRWLWFALIYWASVVVFATVALVLHAVVPAG